MTYQLDALCSAALLVAEFATRAREEAGERALTADDDGRPEDFHYWCDVMVGIEEIQGSGGVATEEQELALIYTSMLAELTDVDMRMSR